MARVQDVMESLHAQLGELIERRRKHVVVENRSYPTMDFDGSIQRICEGLAKIAEGSGYGDLP